MSEHISQTKKAKLEKQNALFNKIMLIPIIVLLAIIPNIVRLELVYPDLDVASAIGSTLVPDFFSVYKASGVIIVTIAMLVISFLISQKDMLKKDKYTITYLISAVVFLGISLISTLTSKYSHTAWWGMPDRSEGMVMTACYVVIFIYTIFAFRKYESYKCIVLPLCFVMVISAFLGVFQYFGHDLLVHEKFFQSIVVPKEIANQGVSLTGLIDEGKIYGTMFHYNYMGSFGAMMVPLFVTLTLFIPGKKNKAFLGLFSIIAMFLLFGSTSRAGLIGLVLAILAGLIIFGKRIVKGWKMVVPVILAVVVVLFGFNAVTHGSIFSRIPTLLNEVTGLFGSSDESFDYKDHIPVREVISENGSFTIVLQKGSLTFTGNNGQVKVTDENGQEVAFVAEGTNYTTSDERFNKVSFEFEPITTQGFEGAASLQISINELNGANAFILMLDANNQIYSINPISGQRQDVVEAPYIGFKGKEKLGSARGYIWSRALPLVKNNLLIGNGPDTFAMVFPQTDVLVKWWAYNTPNMVIDKAHDLYLQFAINNGGLALLAFLVMVIVYVADSFRLYAFRSFYASKEVIGVATMLAVVGYLGAGFFNDSIVSVAPIFWVLLGCGVAINYMINKERKEASKRAEHATINMKTKTRIS